MTTSTFQFAVSPSAVTRRAAARRFVLAHATGGVLGVGASRAAADEFALELAREAGALVGVTRMSLAELATRLALPVLAERLVAPASALGVEAMVARATCDARDAGELGYFDPVADLPGFPRAATRTVAFNPVVRAGDRARRARDRNPTATGEPFNPVVRAGDRARGWVGNLIGGSLGFQSRCPGWG